MDDFRKNPDAINLMSSVMIQDPHPPLRRLREIQPHAGLSTSSTTSPDDSRCE